MGVDEESVNGISLTLGLLLKLYSLAMAAAEQQHQHLPEEEIHSLFTTISMRMYPLRQQQSELTAAPLSSSSLSLSANASVMSKGKESLGVNPNQRTLTPRFLV